MGLDLVAVTVDGKEVDDSLFEGLEYFKESWLRGNIYREYLLEITGYSAYNGYTKENLPDVVKKLEQNLKRRRKYYYLGDSDDYTKEELHVIAESLWKWFKVCLDNGLNVESNY